MKRKLKLFEIYIIVFPYFCFISILYLSHLIQLCFNIKFIYWTQIKIQFCYKKLKQKVRLEDKNLKKTESEFRNRWIAQNQKSEDKR